MEPSDAGYKGVHALAFALYRVDQRIDTEAEKLIDEPTREDGPQIRRAIETLVQGRRKILDEFIQAVVEDERNG